MSEKPRIHTIKGHKDPFESILGEEREEKGEDAPEEREEAPLHDAPGESEHEEEPFDGDDDFLFEHGTHEEGTHTPEEIAELKQLAKPHAHTPDISREEIKQNILLKTRGHSLEDPSNVSKLELLEDVKHKAAFIGRKKSVQMKAGLEGALYVGKIQDDERFREHKLFVDSLNPHVIFTCGSRGSGKSYLLGVLAEELALKNPNVGVVVVDPVGVFWSMKYPNKEEKEVKELPHYDLLPQGLANLRVFIPEGMKSETPKSTYDSLFSIPPSLLTSEDWCLTFKIERFSPTGLLLEKALKKLEKGYRTTHGETIHGKKGTYNLSELTACLETDAELNSKEKGYKADSIRALVSRFEAAKGWGIFADKGTPLSELSKPGQLTVIDTSFLDDTVTALVIGILARRLLAARKIQTRKEAATEATERSVENLLESEIPPTWLFIDEAHTLIPGGNVSTPATNAIVEYVKQGRRPGCSLVFATQQPSAIDTRVLSQLDIIMSHKLIFDDDIKAITKRTPTIIPLKYKHSYFLKTLPVGTALVGDRREETNRAFVLKIRPRMSQHEGRDAETGEKRKELTDANANKLAIELLMSKLEKEGVMDKHTIEQVIHTLNQKYGKKILLSNVLDEMETRGVVIDAKTEQIRSPHYMELIPKKKGSGEETGKTSIERMESLTRLVEMPHESEETDLKAFPVPFSREEIVEKLLKASKKSMLGFGKSVEQLKEITLSYVPIWKVHYRQFTGKTSYVVRECYIDAERGEFLHFIKNQFVLSSGLQMLSGLSEAEHQVLRMLRMSEQTIQNLQKKLGLDERTVKRALLKLIERKLAKAKNEDKLPSFSLMKDVDIPFSGSEKELFSLQALKLVNVSDISRGIPKYSEEQLHTLLTRLWPNVIVTKVSEIYRPAFEATLVNTRTNEHRIVKMDGFTGMIMNE